MTYLCYWGTHIAKVRAVIYNVYRSPYYLPSSTGLQTEELPENIKVNLAVTIGRLAMGDTLEVAELADEYFADWCRCVWVCVGLCVCAKSHTNQVLLTVLANHS